MHLGNIYAALLSWLSAKSQGGAWLLRIEDLDPQRSRLAYARQLEDDLHWMGLDWDEGGLDAIAADGTRYVQSQRGDIYQHYLDLLQTAGLTYPCYCTRADIMATQAPHESDGRVVYAGTCRPPRLAPIPAGRRPATRLMVPDRAIDFTDGHYGTHSVNLADQCGDYIVRRADGAWAYQLAVVVDDALMGVTEVVRGRDLLLSTPQQLHLYQVLGLPAPRFVHLPLLCNTAGQRLSKRDKSLDMEVLRQTYPADEIIGRLAHLAGILPKPEPCRPRDVINLFDWEKVPTDDILID